LCVCVCVCVWCVCGVCVWCVCVVCVCGVCGVVCACGVCVWCVCVVCVCVMCVVFVCVSVCVRCVCVCVILYAKRMRRIILSSWHVRLYLVRPRCLIKDTIFRKKLLNIKCTCWFSVQSVSETFLILRRTERDKIKNVYWSWCKVTVILVIF